MVVVLVSGIIAIPILAVASRVGADTGGLWRHLASTVLSEYLRNTLWLVLGVGVSTVVLGVATAWAVTLCRFPGRSFFRWALLLPLAMPTYLSAYAYTDLLQFSGPVQSSLRSLFDWSRGDYYFPEIRSLYGAVIVLSLALSPYVYLAARAAFVEQSVCVLEVSRTLGHGPWSSFFRVALPLARPSVAVGLSLVLMETLAEFGAVDYFAVDTFATGIYRTFTMPDDHALTAAAQLAACLLLLVAVLVAAEAWSRRAARFHHTTIRHRELPSWRLSGLRGWLTSLICVVPILLGFGVPAAVFVVESWRAGDPRLDSLWHLGLRSLVLGIMAGVLALALALAVAFGRRLRPTPLSRSLARVAGIGYAIPGVVIAIGVLIPLVWLDRSLSGWSEVLFGSGLILSGSLVAVLYGYQVRFLALALGVIRTGLARIGPSIDGAARTLGRPALGMLTSVHLPMLRGSAAAAAALVFVEVIKELPATLILRPFDFDTLAVRVYQLASDERLSEASTGALAVILVGLVPVVALSHVLDRARPMGPIVSGPIEPAESEEQSEERPDGSSER